MVKVFAWLVLLLPGIATAQQLDIRSATALALKNNRELTAARLIIDEAEARMRGAGRLSNPELSVEVAGGEDWEGRVEIGFTQQFPVTSRLRWERKLSGIAVEMARLEVADEERRLAKETQAAFVELVSTRASIALARRQAAEAKSFADALGSQVEGGFASQLDAGQARLALAELEIEGKSLEVEEVIARQTMSTLLGVPMGAPLKTASSLDLPGAAPSTKGVIERPDVKLATMAVEAGDAEVFLAKANRWDDVSVGLFVEGERNRDEPEGISPEGLLGMRVNVPLPFWKNGNAAVEEKRISKERMQHRLDALRLAANNEAAAAAEVLRTSYEAARGAQSQLLPAAREHLTQSEAAHQRGEVDFQQVSRTRERVIQLERAALQALKSYHLARVQWMAAAGNIK